MRKSTRRIVLALGVLLAALAVFATGGWWMLVQTPDWYALTPLTETERAEAARRVEQTWQNTSNWAAQTQARERREANRAQQESRETSADAAAPEAETFEIALTADEINAFIAKWSVMNEWDRAYEAYVTEPRVAVRKGRVIVAGHVKNVPALGGLVVAGHFVPRVDGDGQLRMELASVTGGALPVPDQVWGRYQSQVTGKLLRALPKLQRDAGLNAYGDANISMVGAAMTLLGLQMLDEAPSEPVLFVPIASTDGTRLIPVRVMAINVEDGADGGTIRLKLRAMSSGERTETLQRLKQPYGATATAGAQ